MLRKAIISAVLCISLLLPSAIPVAALGDDSVSAPSAVLMESSTGKIVYEKNSHEQRPCASVTKVMTLLLVFEAIDRGKLSLEDTITASEHAASMGGSDIWLENGETMSADDMIKATVVASANDAAVALAEHLSGSEDAFVEQMNNRAKELGMNDTVFKNCNGLDEEGHVTSANDVAIMSRELTKHEKIFDYTAIWLDNLRDGKTQIVNTNKLLKTYNGITGLKTGTTDDAGCCMSATATRGDVSLISVVLGCESGKQRFADAAALLDYGFANIAVKELKIPEEMPQSLDVVGGMEKTVDLQCDVDSNVVVDKSADADIKTELDLPENLEAPVEENQVVGSLKFTVNGETKIFDITARQQVEETSFGSIFNVVYNSLLAL
ncbi:D-alanyl-D-alanine carboxypeptidase family protein [Ruminococcus sp. YE282]|jgi:D-alanyl-D-alanine carboxypeptidase (penicillin-binding protein 5/6)|uniref:D-alanyl-D-alanine carboxypeptidase family protein n=1 Tax=Ruminococcus sp. YE282 TaxID=3158780 RepID=UPI00088CE72B|nr:D-alanyl-D-alanine carboxypeptidase family protein [Ruminococcus bromii]MEE3497673.1 D-alanyl-D-alanine carboxypeptidase family protein [Ruminococcus bromii]SCY10275.1 D-alanyl-D-alanine carboxypeptidase (penicillin-binding protein 5/6) [Ruminococcus bromii]